MIYDAEKNTLDGKPLQEWKKANSPTTVRLCVQCGKANSEESKFCSACERLLPEKKTVLTKEADKLYWGYGILVVSGISVLSWLISEGWKYLAVGIYLLWPVISFVLIVLASIYIGRSMIKSAIE